MFDDWLARSLGNPSALLRLAPDNLAAERGAGCRKLVLAAAWADCHGAPAAVELADGEPAGQSVLTDRYVRVGPLGTTLVAECCPAELGLAQQTGPVAARNLIGDALSIRHRLPRLWVRVQAGQVWAWKARQVAQRTSRLGVSSARIVDRLVTPHLELMAWQRFEKVLDATMAQVDEAGYQEAEPARTPVPATFDRRPSNDHCAGCSCGSTFDLRPLTPAELTACRTRVVVHVHVTDRTLIDQHGMLRTEHGPITLDQFRRWLTDTDPNLTIQPVLDPNRVAAADAYEIPLAIREAVHTRHPGSVWPYSPATTISTGGRLDLDHTRPYHRHGPPGQTRPGNLAPLTRGEHRAKTVGGWQARQPDSGTHLWRSPHSWITLTTNQGTLQLGDTDWAHQIWHTTTATAAS